MNKPLHKKRCADCDVDKAKRIGRCSYVCAKCGADISLMVLLYEEAKRQDQEA